MRLLLLLPVLVALALAPSLPDSPARAALRSGGGAPLHTAAAQTVSASVGTAPSGNPMADGFVGVSFEYQAVRAYAGRDPHAINPVLVHLLRALAPGQAPVIRIGGNSADETWWPARTIPPAGVRFALTPDWIQTTHALAAVLGAHLILGVNLAAGRPSLAATEARALVRGIGRRYIEALEIGNEPDVYNQFAWYSGRGGLGFKARPAGYNLGTYIQDYSRWAAALPRLPLAGPSFAELIWLGGLGQFISAEPGLKLVTMHRYPLRGCVSDPLAPGYTSFATLLADSSSAGMAAALAPYVPVAHAAGLPFRLGEMNSASCSGRRGVSNTFAAGLWVLDTLFNFAAIGVDGVNLHSLPGAPYELFSFNHGRRGWSAFVHPEYYGMVLFAQAFPPGARLLPVSAPTGAVKIWATRSLTGRTRVVLINKSTGTAATVQLQVPGAGGRASLEWLRAPAVSSTSGVTLGGRTFGRSTASGTLPRLKTSPITATGGTYSIALPPASAVLLTQ